MLWGWHQDFFKVSSNFIIVNYTRCPLVWGMVPLYFIQCKYQTGHFKKQGWLLGKSRTLAVNGTKWGQSCHTHKGGVPEMVKEERRGGNTHRVKTHRSVTQNRLGTKNMRDKLLTVLTVSPNQSSKKWDRWRTLRMLGHTGQLLVLVLISWSVQPVCVSGCDVKSNFSVRRERNAFDSQGRFWIGIRFSGGSQEQRLPFPLFLVRNVLTRLWQAQY